MICLSKEELRQLQMIELELLLEVNRICKKHNIKYNIIGGTLLGSVRHGGFIPWDDDADITMLREEYNKFVSILPKELDDEKYYFQDAVLTEGYRWSYGKLRRKSTVFLRENQEHMPYEQGIFIDIFPVDNIADNMLIRRIDEFRYFCIRKILWSEVGRISDKRLLIRTWYSFISKIPREVVIEKYLRIVNKKNKKKTKYVRIALMPFPNKYPGYRRKWYEESREYVFEGVKLMGIKNYKAFLKYEFGNYMEIPSKEKRKVHPVSKLELFENDLYKEKCH